MIDHPAPTLIEQLAIGGPVDDAVVSHCAACDVCAERLAREARLELALGELHAFRAAEQRKNRRLLVRLAPVLVFAAAAAILFALRRPAPRAEVRPDPSATPPVSAAVLVAPPPPIEASSTPVNALPSSPTPRTVKSVTAPAATNDPTPSDTDVVIAKLRPRFKACYQENLRVGGPTNGKIVLGAKLDADGDVLDVTIDSNTGFTAEMTTCLVEVLGRAHFTGTGKPSTIHVPITFVQQH